MVESIKNHSGIAAFWAASKYKKYLHAQKRVKTDVMMNSVYFKSVLKLVTDEALRLDRL